MHTAKVCLHAAAQQGINPLGALEKRRREEFNLNFRNSQMIRISMIAAAAITLVGAALPASAHDIRVTVTGKDAATLHHDLWQAARKACDAELAGSVLAYEAQQPCIRHAVKAAEENIAQGKFASNSSQMASAQ
jgi:hypothetical protein